MMDGTHSRVISKNWRVLSNHYAASFGSKVGCKYISKHPQIVDDVVVDIVNQ